MNMTKLKLASLLLAVVGILSLAVSAPAVAASEDQKSQITVTPTKLQLDLDPGQQIDGEYTAINTGDLQVTIKVYASPYRILDSEYNRQYDDTTWSRAQLASWVSYEQDEFTLDPEESVVVRYRIEVPTNVPAGGHYAMLMTEIQPDDSQGDGASIISKKRIGISAMAHVAGETVRSGSIASDEVGFWQTGSTVESSLAIENTGKIHFPVKTQMKVHSLLDKLIYTSDELELDVLPDTTRAMDHEWSEASIGLYRVELVANFLNEDHVVSRWVLVMPLWIPLVAFIVLFAGLVHWLYRKRKNKSKGKKG